MAVEEVVSALPSQVSGRIGGLITIFEAIGIVVLVYIVYALVMGFLAFKRIRKMRYIEKKVDSIDRKLGILLKDNKKKKKDS